MQREERPITVSEIGEFLPTAERLVVDHGPQRGRFVVDAEGNRIGYAIRSSPYADSIIGYAGPTDTLMVFDRNRRLLGVKLRHSWDTITHGQDVATDRYFLSSFSGMTWDEIAQLDIKAAGIEGVSGATLTSLCVVQSMKYRLGKAVQENIPPPRKLQVATRDVGMVVVVATAFLLTFTRASRRKWLRRAYQLAVIAYLGFYLGEMLALPLLVGWAQSGVPWHAAPGMTLLVAAAFVLPFATRRPTYCAHICPHGAAQELLGRVAKRKLRLPRGLDRGMKWIPLLLLGFALIVTMLELPFDLASVEPFDAYIFRAAGWATIAIAVAGLVASLFVPQAYCKYGCPTGSLLELVRSHGRADRFNRRDAAAVVLLLLAIVMYWQYETIYGLITGL